MTSCSGTSSSGGDIVGGKKSTPMHSDVIDNMCTAYPPKYGNLDVPRRHGKHLIVLIDSCSHQDHLRQRSVSLKICVGPFWCVFCCLCCSWHIGQQTELCPEGKDMRRWVSISPCWREKGATTFSLKLIRFSKLGFRPAPHSPVQSLSFIRTRGFLCPWSCDDRLALERAEEHLGCNLKVMWPSDTGMWLPEHVIMR